MDKDKFSDIHGQFSWMEMHQFIGDLMTSGNTSKNPPDVLNAAWGVGVATAAAGGGEALGLKGASLGPLQQPRPAQVKSSQRKGETRDKREDVHIACPCPGCPYSASPPHLDTLKLRQSLSSGPGSSAGCLSTDLSSTAPMSLGMCLGDAEPSSTTTAELQTGQREEGEGGRRSLHRDSDSPPPANRAPPSGCLSHLSMFPCLCCHRGLQTCGHILSQQDDTDSPFSHTHHAHHHFHHHHCPVSSCLPCPQLARSNAPLLAAGPFPCLSSQRSFPDCTQVCRHQQHRQTNSQQQGERGRAATAAAMMSLHPCMHCSASFSRPSQLLQHQRSDHPHKPAGFLCTECGRAFNSHSNLRIHQNVHTGARPYTCSDCGKSFSQSGALKIHRRIHTGERPYSCGFCGRGFPHLAGVRAHQRTHTGEKPYSCSQCGKCFTQSGALKIHLRIHTGERPFVCSVCGRGFSNRSGIRFHYRTVHGLAPEHAGEAGPGLAPLRQAGRGYSLGRPRTFPPAVGLNAPSSSGSNSHTIQNSRDSQTQSGAALLISNEGKSQSEGANPGRNGGGLLYMCEDCGLRFKDAPSRNRHQTLMHYSSEGREEEEGNRKE